MRDKFVDEHEMNLICKLSLFIYRESAVAGLFFWIAICIFVHIIFTTGNQHEVSLIIQHVLIFCLYYVSFMFCFSCTVYVMILSMSIRNIAKHHFFISLIIHLITLMLCYFSIPAIQTA